MSTAPLKITLTLQNTIFHCFDSELETNRSLGAIWERTWNEKCQVKHLSTFKHSLLRRCQCDTEIKGFPKWIHVFVQLYFVNVERYGISALTFHNISLWQIKPWYTLDERIIGCRSASAMKLIFNYMAKSRNKIFACRARKIQEDTNRIPRIWNVFLFGANFGGGGHWFKKSVEKALTVDGQHITKFLRHELDEIWFRKGGPKSHKGNGTTKFPGRVISK